MLIPFILDKALSLYKDKEAVVCGDSRFTYGRFAERAYGLSWFMHDEGIRRGDCIAILHQNNHEFLETYFATAHLGAVLNPLNTRLSPGELSSIVKDSEAKWLIASTRFASLVEAVLDTGIPIRKIIWTGTGERPEGRNFLSYEDITEHSHKDPPPTPPMSEEDVAYLYYTSGTTGLPKGVMLSHKNVCIHALAAIAELGLTDRDRWIHAAPLFHLADAWATFAVTWVGGCHVIAEDFKPSAVLEKMQRERVTITNMIPTMLNMLVNTPGVKDYDFSSLRVMLSGGAPIAPDVVRRIMETFRCDYIQTYGMTETSPYLTLSVLKENLRLLPPEEQFLYKAKTGRPFMGVLLKVVREDGTEVVNDDTEVGEIIVKGDTVSKGYWKRPVETSETLKDGWLYTGDMATIDPEGYVHIVDRKKDVIITGGENVYSIEVENVLYSHPAVLEAAVVGVPDPKWGETVKAVVVPKPGQVVTEEEIIQYCKERIARYKAPKSVDFVSELPKSGSGKIYKKTLRDRYR